MTAPRPSAVVILAAGEGTRMKSATPKVLHSCAGRTLLGHVVAAAGELDPVRLVVVVGHGRERVTEHLAAIAPAATVVVQAEQNGTGHAVRIALDELALRGDDPAEDPDAGPVVVLTGDTPLLTGATLTRLVAAHGGSGALVTVLTAVLPDPTGYGRVLRTAEGHVEGIVEQKDASDEQRAIREINSGMYAFAAATLRDTLTRLTTDNAQGEEYLTDVVGIVRGDGGQVDAVVVGDSDEILGVNDRVQLATAAAIWRDRLNDTWMRAGVSILDPATTWIDVDVELAPDVTLRPSTHLVGATTVARGASIGPGSTLRDCEVGEDADVLHTWAELAVIGPRATVGPFTFLRPGTRLGTGAKAGAYVEIKNSEVGDGSKVPHLSYVGDATIGTGSNIGAATVFVNYDGVAKHRTVVGDDVRIGSDTMLVAPVEVGDGAYTAAGSVITDDVPPGAMAVGRARQRNVEGWVERRRPDTASARSAARAQARQGDPQPDEQEDS